MKMNKLAAGALALALGLGAVAPAVAAEKGTGTNIVESLYNEKLVEAQKYYDQRNAARETVRVAKERYETAKKAVEVAEKKYKDLPADKDENPLGTIDQQITDAASKVEEARRKVAVAVKNYNEEYKKDKPNKETLENFKAEVTKSTKALDEAVAKHAELVKKKELDLPEIDKNKLQPKAQALVDLVKAQQELANAYGAYGIALDNEKALNEKFKTEYDKLANFAKDAGAIVSIEGSKIVVKPAKSTAKKSQEELKAELKAAIDKSKIAVNSAEFLLKEAPKSVAKVKDKLEKQIKDAKAIIEKSEKALKAVEKKMAFVATAYAAEDDVDLEALIKENEDAAKAINDTIKENEKEQPEVEEKEKEEEKKPEEKKPEEKKPEENKPARKAGNNAKTGIAGVAGVAGILAAASVAYAASKRD